MIKTMRYSPQEVSDYILRRLKSKKRGRGKEFQQSMKGSPKKKKTCTSNEKISRRPYTVENALREIDDLISEKRDLLKQIVSDQSLHGHEHKYVSHEEVLKVLDDLKTMDNIDVRMLAGMIGPKQGFGNTLRLANQRLAEIAVRIDSLSADEEIARVYRERVVKRIGIIRSARNVEGLRRLAEKAEMAKIELLARRNNENAALTKADTETIAKYDLIQKKIREKIDIFMGNDEIYYETKRRRLLDLRRQLLNDGFVETDNIRKTMLDIVSHLQLGIPVLLRGHLGVGKTEIALHASRKYFGVEPEFISGSEEATKYDIYGKTQIGIRSEEDKVREFRRRMDEYRRINPEKTGKALEEVERQYYQSIVVQGITTSFFQYGPLIRAIRLGKPLLIDEMDGIPHSIIMRLNHILTRRPGDTVRVQENGGDEITVREGFCVLATGNIKSARYKREELDAAFLSRWWSNDIQYPPQDETYEILVASLLDGQGNLQVRRLNDLDDLKRLTEAASEIQQIFSGDRLDYYGEGADVARNTPAGLKKSVLSLRHLWNIVRPWKARNFDRPIDHYILNEFIRPAVAEDQLYLIQLLCRYRFFKTWHKEDFNIPGLTQSKLLAFQGEQARPAASV